MKKIAKLILMLAFSFTAYFGAAQAASASYAVIDADTGRLLYGSSPHVRMPIASLTKMWTALVAIENADIDMEVTISHEAANAEGSAIYVEPGEKVKLETLLYGLMLRSGNDAAYAIAESVGGSIEGFVDLMNEKALYYGLKSTYFTNPSGLHHEFHISTAYDTALMLKYAMDNEQFREIATTITYNATDKLTHGTNWLNKHRLLREKVGAIAGKTGFTKAAGRTLATYFEKDDKRVIVVTLNESNDWQVHKYLAQKAFDEYKKVTIADKGSYTVNNNISVNLEEPIKLLLNANEENELKNVLYLSRKQNEFGVWHVFLNNQSIFTKRVTLEN
ncbi:D-alanyl-D-alanine carboxypeptidase family protein [Ureibacillus sp. MALMAid1270]|uniref:D-alanyl-D-alanine carboxypeptidase family protein n=1 Tax=Ureibacillus sp. MALMAid1270 TaxID=3411629 RepID=UPI003BA61576